MLWKVTERIQVLMAQCKNVKKNLEIYNFQKLFFKKLSTFNSFPHFFYQQCWSGGFALVRSGNSTKPKFSVGICTQRMPCRLSCSIQGGLGLRRSSPAARTYICLCITSCLSPHSQVTQGNLMFLERGSNKLEQQSWKSETFPKKVIFYFWSTSV